MIETFKNCFSVNQNGVIEERFTKWNNNNHSCVILNVDGSCLGSPTRAGYGGLLRNYAGYYLSVFSGYIHNSTDILYAELFAIYQGLLLAKEKNVAKIVCYSDSMHCINLIKGPAMKFHSYVVLIQDIKNLFVHLNVTICHTLREGNQCADFMVNLGASLIIDACHHASPPEGLLSLLKMDAAVTIFPRL
jgi:ribonuclease HI